MSEREGRRVVLKRYANRRLYDPRQKRHVTLEQVAGMIGQGCTVEVRAAKDGKDETSFVLTQVLLDQARRRELLLPPEALHLIIRHGRALDGFLRRHFAFVVDAWLACRGMAEDGFRAMFGPGGRAKDPAQGLREALRNIFGGLGPR